MLGRVEKKNAQNRYKKVKNIFFDQNKYQRVTHVSKSIFQGLFKNKVFRSVALVSKMLWAILDFLHRPDFLPLCTFIKNDSGRAKN